MFLVYHTAATSRSIYVTLIVSPWNTHNQFNVEWTVVIHTTLELCILLKVSEKKCIDELTVCFGTLTYHRYTGIYCP